MKKIYFIILTIFCLLFYFIKKNNSKKELLKEKYKNNININHKKLYSNEAIKIKHKKIEEIKKSDSNNIFKNVVYEDKSEEKQRCEYFLFNMDKAFMSENLLSLKEEIKNQCGIYVSNDLKYCYDKKFDANNCFFSIQDLKYKFLDKKQLEDINDMESLLILSMKKKTKEKQKVISKIINEIEKNEFNEFENSVPKSEVIKYSINSYLNSIKNNHLKESENYINDFISMLKDEESDIHNYPGIKKQIEAIIYIYKYLIKNDYKKFDKFEKNDYIRLYNFVFQNKNLSEQEINTIPKAYNNFIKYVKEEQEKIPEQRFKKIILPQEFN